ncbi:UNVERIFIED_CONTAM: hypothetical protein FKN15_057696 [Acipenser sinensis]
MAAPPSILNSDLSHRRTALSCEICRLFNASQSDLYEGLPVCRCTRGFASPTPPKKNEQHLPHAVHTFALLA